MVLQSYEGAAVCCGTYWQYNIQPGSELGCYISVHLEALHKGHDEQHTVYILYLNRECCIN